MEEIVSPVANVEDWRRQLIRRVLRVMSAVGFLMLVAGSYYAYVHGISLVPVLTYVVVYVIIVSVTLWREPPFLLQVVVIQILLYAVAVVTFPTGGLGDSSRLYLVAVIFTSAIFLSWRATVFTIILVALTMLAFGWAFSTGRIVGYRDVVSSDVTAWLALSMDTLGLGIFIAFLVNFFMRKLTRYVTRAERLAAELQVQRANLEEEVKKRTAALEQHNIRLELVTRLVGEITAIRDPERLLEDVVRAISSRLGFYHVAIFLWDESGDCMVLRAAALDGKRHAAVLGYRVARGEGLPGRVAESGRAEMVPEERSAFTLTRLPALTDTRSEVALPIRVHSETVGILDIQEREEKAFRREEMAVLQTLADQVGMALGNAELFSRVEEALEAERRAYGELSREAWKRLLKTGDWNQRYDPYGLLARASDEDEHLFSVPIKVRDRIVGTVRAYPSPRTGSLTGEQKELLRMLTEQLGVALESARLYRSTQKRAALEQLSAEVMARIRETLDMDTVMQTTVKEIREALELHDVVIRLETGKRDEEAI